MKQVTLIATALAALLTLQGTSRAETYISGFAELTQAVRYERNYALDNGLPFEDRKYPRGDVRGQVKFSGGGERDEYFVRIDFLRDYALNRDVEVDVREAYVKLFVSSRLDIKVGRQVATWGVGDLLFVNDLFAKDWVAFFTGQELSYLKRPQDLARLSFYSGGATIELAVAPYYTMDNLPYGERLSVFNPLAGMTVSSDGAATVMDRDKNLSSAEIFVRVSGYAGASEWALYGYRGFFPQPQGFVTDTSGTPVALFAPRLNSIGASFRGNVGEFLVSAEGAFYHSEDDSDGDDPFLPNSSVKGLLGIEKSLGNETTISTQWFGDVTLDYDKFSEPFVMANREVPVDEVRHTVTLRLMKFMRNQTVRLNLFGYWGISDEDYYLRPSVDYDYSDNLKVTIGANILDGDKLYTMFGQFRDNSNLYLRLRRSF